MDTSTAIAEPTDVETASVPRLVNGIDAERHELFSFDATPLPVVAQGLLAVRELCSQLRAPERPEILRFVDPMAGSGPFGQVARDVFGNLLSVAIEAREEERANLPRHYDAVYIDRFQACAEIGRDFGAHLISTNPKFDLWPELLPWALSRLAPKLGVLALYGRTYWGHSDEGAERADLFTKYPPNYTLRVSGRVRHRVGRNEKGKPFATDSHKYSWWVWDLSKPAIPRIRVQLDLPQLLPHELRFTTIPGQLEAADESEVAS